MAERLRTEAIFKLYGCVGDDGVEADTGTIYWLATTMGLDSATMLYGMDKAMIDSVFKRLVKDAEDITIPEERRPRSTVQVMGALTTVVRAVRYYADRGVPLTLELLEMMHHRNAVNFFDRSYHSRKADVDGDAKIDLPVLPANVARNSVQFHDWMDGVKVKLEATQSVDGVGTAHATIRENVAPLEWADVDVTEELDAIADKICPLGGTVHRQDQKRLHAALGDACKHAGKSFVDKHQRDMDGRSSWLEIRRYFYPPRDIEDQVDEIEKRIRTTYFQGPDTGYSYERVVGIHRKMHARLNDLGRSWTETEKVKAIIGAMKHRTTRMEMAISIIKGDRDGVDAKYNNFENVVDFLWQVIPVAKDSLRGLKAVKTAKGGDDDYPKEWDHAGRFLTDAERKSEAQVVPFRVYKEYSPGKRARITSDRIRFGIKVGKKSNAKGKNKEKDKDARFKSDPRREYARLKAQITSLKARLAASKGIGNVSSSDSDSSEANPGAIKRGGRKRSEAAEASFKHRKKSK